MKEQRLTPDRIVAAARDIARADGIDAVSMRRLAEELDVWPMSMYRYFGDKDELLDAVVGSVAAEIETPDPSLPWRDQLGDLATSIHTTLEPGDLAARLSQATLSPGVLALSETGLSILTAAGFAPDEAARAWLSLLAYSCSRPPSAPARAARSALAGLDEDESPTLAAAAESLSKTLADDREAFAYGLARLLDGLEQRLSGATSAQAR